MWPDANQYNEAIQNPDTAFADNMLRSGVIATNSRGLPLTYSGNFAIVFRVNGPDRRALRAVRCFTTQSPTRAYRYHAITAALKDLHLPFLVDFEYKDEGIRVGGQWYPIVVMPWIEAPRLDQFVEKHVHEPNVLIGLAKSIVLIHTQMTAVGLAHGDLQHENILVVGDQPRLIDYDGMYVPAFAGQPAPELGRREYQHPKRTPSEYGPFIDVVPTWVLVITLLALARNPPWWSRCNGDHMLFSEADLRHPDNSDTFKELLQSGNDTLATLTREFQAVLQRGPRDMTAVPMDIIDLGQLSTAATMKWWVTEAPATRPAPQLVSFPQWDLPKSLPVPAPPPSWSITTTPPALSLGRLTGLRAFLGAVASLSLTVALGLHSSAGDTLATLATMVGLFGAYYRWSPAVGKRAWRSEVHAAKTARKQAERDLEEQDSHHRATMADTYAEFTDAQNEYERLLSNRQNRLDKLRARYDQSVKDARDAVDALNAQERKDTLALLASHRQRHIEQRLLAASVRDCPFGRGFPKEALIAAGLRSAADFHGFIRYGTKVFLNVRGNNEHIHGIGPERAQQLQSWHDELLRFAERTAPTTISSQEKQALGAKYGSQRVALEKAAANAARSYQLDCDRIEYEARQRSTHLAARAELLLTRARALHKDYLVARKPFVATVSEAMGTEERVEASGNVYRHVNVLQFVRALVTGRL